MPSSKRRRFARYAPGLSGQGASEGSQAGPAPKPVLFWPLPAVKPHSSLNAVLACSAILPSAPGTP